MTVYGWVVFGTDWLPPFGALPGSTDSYFLKPPNRKKEESRKNTSPRRTCLGMFGTPHETPLSSSLPRSPPLGPSAVGR